MKFEVFSVNKYQNDKTIILYGDAWMSHITNMFLEEKDIKNVLYANFEGKARTVFSHALSFEDVIRLYDEKKYMILWNENVASRIETKRFEDNGITYVYSVRELWENPNNIDILSWGEDYHNIYSKRNDYFFIEDTIQNTDRVYLFSLDAVVTERCSLKCRNCANLMQYYRDPKDFDVDALISNINVLLEKVDRIHDLRILGGEPFMNCDFIKLITSYEHEKKIDKISIFTNATIFPDGDKSYVLDYLKSSKITMRMSNYGELSRALDKWITWCQKNDVDYQVYAIDIWDDIGQLKRYDYTINQLKDLYGNCTCRNIPTIIDNKLFNCAYAANAFNLGAMAANEAKKDYLELNSTLTSKEIDRFLYERPFLEACKYCGGRNHIRQAVKPYIQTKKPLEYEVLSDINIENDKKINLVNNEKPSDMVSIVIPVYNAEKTIEKCVRSIINQTYKNIEIFLVNDGSTDHSLKLCYELVNEDKNYILINESRIKVIDCPHRGVVAARMAGITLAKGRFITFVDADDYIEEDCIEKMCLAMADVDICIMNWYTEKKKLEIKDNLFDRGQATREILKTFPKEGIYEGREYWKLMVDHIEVKWDGLFDPVWNKMFVTTKLQQIAGTITQDIIWKEDLLLVFSYVLQCTKIKVLDYIGYHWVVDNTDFGKNKYDFTKLILGLGYVYDRLMSLENENCVIESLKSEIIYRYLDRILSEANRQLNKKKYYYPYYGRLDAKNIILYGAGNVGKSYYKSIQYDIKVHLVAWVDKNYKKINEQRMLPVDNPERLLTEEYDYVIIAVYEKPIYMGIRAELEEMGIPGDKIIWNSTMEISCYW